MIDTTTTYTTDLGPIDEDGYRSVRITGPDGYDESYYLRYDQASQWAAQEIALLQAMYDADGAECEHGLNAGLCSGPQHY